LTGIEFGREEWFEHMGELIRIDSIASVDDFKQQFAVAFSFKNQLNGFPVQGSFERIEDQIVKDLPKFWFVDIAIEGLGPADPLNLNRLVGTLSLDPTKDLQSQLMQVDSHWHS
jgi:hypothetical protein